MTSILMDKEPPGRPLACRPCRRRKIRCDHESPCKNCVKANIACIPSSPAPPRPRRRPRIELQERLARCEELLEQLKTEEIENTSPVTNPSSSQRSSLENPPSTQGPVIRNGKLLVDKGAVRFTDGWLWGAVFEEVLAMKSLEAGDSTYEESHSDSNPLPNNSQFDDFREETDFDDLSDLEPLPSQMHYLWQVFLDRVHPLTKLIHAPTVEPYLIEAVCSTGSLSHDLRALLFSIFSLATLSLDEDEAWNMLGSPRENAFQRFSAGLRMALKRARFLELPNLTLLQAFTFYLMSLQGRYGSREIWILNSVCVRMAQKMGVHRDGELLGLPPFEIEMRRRVWWQIVILDLKSARASGLSLSSLPSTTDCKMPTNIDDADLHPDATEPFKDQNGPTEMIISLLMSKIGQLSLMRPGIREILSHGEATVFGPPSDANDGLDEFKRVSREIEEGLESVMEKYSSPAAGPIHEFASAVKLALSSKISEFGEAPSEQPEWGTEIITVSDHVFKLSIISIEQFAKLHQTSRSKGFLWSILFNIHYDIFAHMVGQLSFRTYGSLVERAWSLVPIIYSIHNEYFDTSQPPNVALANFVLRAWKIRSSVLCTQLGIIPDVPDYIQRLDQSVRVGRAS